MCLFNKLIKIVFSTLALSWIITFPANAQNTGQEDIYKPEPYEVRIIKEYINGVYIPKDISDVLLELDRKVEPEGLKAFKEFTEEEAASKSFFGFGRWMSHNWGLEEGSRLSHYFRLKGLSNVEDMTRVLMISYHRYINNKPLAMDDLIQYYSDLRQAKYLKEMEEFNRTGVKDTIPFKNQ